VPIGKCELRCAMCRLLVPRSHSSTMYLFLLVTAVIVTRHCLYHRLYERERPSWIHHAHTSVCRYRNATNPGTRIGYRLGYTENVHSIHAAFPMDGTQSVLFSCNSSRSFVCLSYGASASRLDRCSSTLSTLDCIRRCPPASASAATMEAKPQ
jgi:hypothetical protein